MRTLYWLTPLLLSLLLGACVHGKDRGDQALEQHDFDRAFEIAQQELDDDAHSPWANLLMAQTLVATGDYRRALPYARRADQSEAFPVETPLLLGEIYTALGRPVDAVESYQAARDADPHSVEEATMLEALERALAFATTRADHQARWQILNWIAAIDDDHRDASPQDLANARRTYATHLRRRGEYQAAAQLLEEALDDDPGFLSREALDLGSLYARLDMHEDAAFAWRRYIDADVADDEQIQRYEDVIQQADQLEVYDFGIEIIEELWEDLDGDLRYAHLLVRQVRFQLQTGQTSEARQTAREYLDLAMAQSREGQGPTHPFGEIAEIAMEFGEARFAINVLERGTVEAQPDQGLTESLAQIYARRAEMGKVEETLNRYVERHANSEAALEHVGAWALRRNNYELAAHYYQRLTEMDDAPARAWRDLAAALAGMESEEDAMIQAIYAYVEARGDSDASLRSAAQFFSNHRLYEEAERLLTRLRDRSPTSRDVTRHLARLYRDWSRPDDALRVWEEWIDARGGDVTDIASVARILYRSGDMEGASRMFTRAAEQGRPEFWLEAADIYLYQDHMAAMVRSLDRLVDEHDDRVWALQSAADRYRRARMESRQIEMLAELVELRPDDWQTHERLANLLIDAGRNDEAFDHLRRFVDRSGNRVEALQRIGSHVSPRRQPSWMLEFYRTFEDEDLGPDMDRLMGEAYYALSRQYGIPPETQRHARRQARDLYLSFLEATEEEQRNWFSLANQWRQQEMWRPALIAFDRYAEQDGRSHERSMAYAETLLHLGEMERAAEVLERYFQHNRRRPDVAGRISRLLSHFGLYDQVEDFASQMFISGDDSSIHEGFMLLAEIRQQQEDMAGLIELTNDYLQRSRNTHRARRAIATVLADTGQWKEAAHALGEFDLTVVYQFAVEIGYHHYRQDDPDQAFEYFELAANHANRPERSWLDAATFLQARGDVDAALDAFERARAANPDDLVVRAARGAFLIERGDLEGALEEYEFSRASSSTFGQPHRISFFNAFFEAGYFEMARQVFRDMERDGHSPPADIAGKIGAHDLRSGDRATRERGVDRVRAGHWGLYETLDSLVAAGRLREVGEQIAREFDEGDKSRASLHMLRHTNELTRLVGWDQQLEQFHDALDPLRRSDNRLLGLVGDQRLRAGQRDDARLYLQAAVDEDDAHYLPQLGHTLLLLGEREQALEYFETWLLRESAGYSALESLLLRFELAGDPQGAILFLERIIDQPTLVDFALPYKVHYDLERHGDPDRALDAAVHQVRAMEKLPSTAFRADATIRQTPGMSRDEMLGSALIRSLETVAALGHIEVVRARLDQDLPLIRPHQLDHLRLKLALAEEDLPTAIDLTEPILDAVDGARELQDTRLDLARRFTAFGADGAARELVDQALAEQTGFDNHDPFALHLGLLLLAGEEDLMPAIDSYLDRVPNRRHARTMLIDELRRLGRDGEALSLARQAVEDTPTTTMLTVAMTSAFEEGDAQTLVELTDILFRIADDPAGNLAIFLNNRLRGAEPRLLLPMVERVRQARPSSLTWIIHEARLRFAAGQIEEARNLLDDALSERSYHRDAVTPVAQMLAEELLDVELARVIAPNVPDESLWPRLAVLFAEANLALGFEEDAAHWLTRLDELAEEPKLWRMELADRLVNRQIYEPLDVALGDADDDASYGPHLQMLRGIHRLATGDGQAGLALVHEANAGGVSLYTSHFPAIQAALYGEQTEAAMTLMEDFASMPTRDSQVVSVPLQVMLAAGRNIDAGPATVRAFLESHRPRLVDGHGATWTQFAGQLAMAFEQTGDAEGAYGFYRDRIWQSLLQRHDDASLPIYYNNLAYTYSTTNHNIDRGKDKVYRAIILRDRRSPSFIDTLGWLLYRQGDLEGAEREIRRALRSYDGPPSGLYELKYHLKVILRERGIYDEAAWTKVHLNRLPPETLDW